MYSIAILELGLLFACGVYTSTDEVLVHPESIMVPAGTEFSLTCQIRTTRHVYWIVNSTEATGEFHRQYLATKGLHIEGPSSENGVVSLILRVNGSYDNLNNTRVFCTSVQVRTEVATILIIAAPPVQPNPVIEVESASSLLVIWSPPFLWPGHSIMYYNISVIDPNDGSITYHRVNTSYSDKVVKFTFSMQYKQNCTEFIFGIMAVKKQSDLGGPLKNISAVGGFPTAPGEVNVTLKVLFEADGSPLVLIQFEIPSSICSYQAVNYSTIIMNVKGEDVKKVGPRKYSWPYALASDTEIHEFIYGLESDKEYLLAVVIETEAGNSTTIYSFNTNRTGSLIADLDICMETSVSPSVHGIGSNYYERALYMYKVLVSVSFSAAVTLLLSLLCVLTCLIVKCKLRHKRNTQATAMSANRVQHVMVHNPIYDGPMYETVQSTFALKTQITNASTKSSSDQVYSETIHAAMILDYNGEEFEKPIHDRHN